MYILKINLDKELFDFRNITRILKIILGCSKKLTATRIILILIQAILPLVPLYLMKLMLDAFASEIKPDFTYILWILGGFALAQLLSILITNVMSYVVLLQSDIVSDHMSQIVLSKSIETDLEYFDSDTYHDIFERAITESQVRPLLVLNSLTELALNGITLLAIAGLLLTLHWGVTLVLLLIALPVALIRWFYAEKLVVLREQQTQRHRRSKYFHQILSFSEYAKEIRIFDFGRNLLDRFLRLRSSLRNEKKHIYFNQTRSIGLAQSVESIAIIAALGFIAQRAIRGLISVGDIALYYGAFQKGQSNINSVLKALVSIHENRMYLTHLFTFLDLEKKIVDVADPVAIPKELNVLEFRDISFTYPGTTNEVLQHISFSAKKGELVAIVGENGSGKSTIVKLINRLYQPTKGSILVNGTDISHYNITDLRKKLTVIFQEFSKFNATVNENIQFADVHRPLDQERINSASEQALSSEFIEKLPQRYKTQLGRSFKAGEELSGGQWQKLALSRAFYKNADILILDEPTSFIDPLAEDDIFNNLQRIAKDKILILITHRIYNLKKADLILVLDKGRIIERGNHNSLMKENGRYRAMFESQE